MKMILPYLLKYWREVLIVILIMSGSIHQCQRNNSDNADLIEFLVQSRDSAFLQAKYYKNELGQMVGQVKTQTITIEQLKEHGITLGIDNENLKKQVGNLSRLVAHWKGKASFVGSTTVPLKDSSKTDPITSVVTPFKTFEWSNKYLGLNGEIYGKEVSIWYSYEVDFSLTSYYKPTGFLKKPQLVTDIYFSDQNFVVKEFKGFVVQEPKLGFFQRPIVKIGLAALAGFAVGKL